MPRDEPRRERQEPVVGVRISTLELGEAARALGLQDADGALDIVKVRRQLVIRHDPEVLTDELVGGRTQGAHVSGSLSNWCSDICEIGHGRDDCPRRSATLD